MIRMTRIYFVFDPSVADGYAKVTITALGAWWAARRRGLDWLPAAMFYAETAQAVAYRDGMWRRLR